MNYVTTNIRISEEDYLRLKLEAASKRTSLSGVIREKISINRKGGKSTKKLLLQIRKLASHNAKVLKDWDSLKALREIRTEN